MQRRVTLMLDEDLWRQTRLTALKQNVTASELVSAALRFVLTGGGKQAREAFPVKTTEERDG